MKYIDLYHSLRKGIIEGVWAYGAQLPSKRRLAEEYGISRITAEHSLELLTQEGYIEARPRSGYYVSYRPDFSSLPEEGSALPAPDHTRFSQNNSCIPFPTLARAMRRVLSMYGEQIMIKSPNQGNESLRNALSAYLKRNRGIMADPRQIVIGSGAEYLYGLISEMLGDDIVVAIESPGYKRIEEVYRNRHIPVQKLPLGKDGIDSASLQQCSADVLHITPFRSYPSGITASASKRAEYILWAQSGNRFIIEDDHESEFSLLRKPEDTLFTLSDAQNVIYMNTFSKTVSPSIRVGYMVLPARMLPVFERQVGFYSCTVPAFEQLVLTELIASGDFDRHINRIRRMMRKNDSYSQ